MSLTAHIRLLAIAVVVAVFASPATAQDSERWTSADGRISMSIPAGWRSETTTPAGVVLLISPPGFDTGADTRACMVRHDPAGPDVSSLSQAQLNALLESSQQRRMARYNLVHSNSNVTVDGIMISSVDFEDGQGAEAYRQIDRTFVVATGGPGELFIISCRTSLDGEESGLADMNAFLASLTLHPRTAQ